MTYHILIIDREPVQRELLIHAFQNRLGYRASTVATVAEAEKYFQPEQKMRPDLVLMEWSATDAASIAALKSLSVKAPVVALIKYGDYNAAMTALSAGAQDFLSKPVAMERVSTTFRNLLLLRDARREVERLRRERMQGAGLLQSPEEPNLHMPTPFQLIGTDGNIRPMEEIEAESIRFAMQYYHGRMTEVARRLGIGRSTLYRKLSEIGISRREEEAA